MALMATEKLPHDADATALLEYLERTPGWEWRRTHNGEASYHEYIRSSGASFAGQSVYVPLFDAEWLPEMVERVNAVADDIEPSWR